MENPQVSNPNDFKVVQFHNKEDFGFTPDMGCMYDGRPISGITGAPGINAGETITLPYHIGHQLAINLAKVAMTRLAPSTDPAGIPTGVPLWDTVKLENMKMSYLTDLYTEAKPIALSETDRLMAKVEELNRMVMDLTTGKMVLPTPVVVPAPVVDLPPASAHITPPEGSEAAPIVYQDKQEVIAELEKRGVKFDRRQNKANLEKLLTPELVAA